MPHETRYASTAEEAGFKQQKRVLESESEELSRGIKRAKTNERFPSNLSAQIQPVDDTTHASRDRIRKFDAAAEEEGEEGKDSSDKVQLVEDTSLKLTAKNLKQHRQGTKSQRSQLDSGTALCQWDYTKMGSPKKSDLAPSSLDQSNKTDATTKSVSTTDTKFPKLLRKNRVLDAEESSDSSNFATATNDFGRARETPSPTVEQFEEFRQDVWLSENEWDVEVAVLSMLKKYKDKNYKRVRNQQFNEFPRNIGFNDGLSNPKPDHVEGYLEKSFEPYDVKDRLGGSAVPTGSKYPIALAHFAGEFKKSGGDLNLASQQAAYDAACLVFSRNNAAVSIGKADEADTAHVSSFYTDGNHLTISIHYSAKGSSGETVYHQNPVFTGPIRASHESFKTGWRHLRNAQDWTRENARLLKDGLIAHENQPSKGTEENRNLSNPEFAGNYQQQLNGLTNDQANPTSEFVEHHQ